MMNKGGAYSSIEDPKRPNGSQFVKWVNACTIEIKLVNRNVRTTNTPMCIERHGKMNLTAHLAQSLGKNNPISEKVPAVIFNDETAHKLSQSLRYGTVGRRNDCSRLS